MPHSLAHYMVTIRIGKGVVDAVIDTGAARTIIDAETAKRMGLPIEVATRSKSFGTYWGPSGPESHYYGRIPGPVKVEFSKDIFITLPEIKVINSLEPLVLLGTDLLTDSTQEWAFS